MIEENSVSSFEAHLASLKPRGPKLDRDRLMFLAGQASVAYVPTYRPSSFRPAAISALVAAAVTLAVVTATQSGVRIVDMATAASAETREMPPARPARDASQPRVDVGNSLGWFFSLLGSPAAETDSTKTTPSLVKDRIKLLEEELGSAKDEGRSTKEEGKAEKSPAVTPKSLNP